MFNKFLFLRNVEYFISQARRLTVVTFNFDRSFEYALFENLRHGFGLDAAKARQAATELAIHHVHGVLGEPDWLTEDKSHATPYGVPAGDLLVTATGIAVDSIKIVDEEIPVSLIEDIETALDAAAFVYFIGFGFDERNLNKLRSRTLLSNTIAVRGTVLGWSLAECQPVRRYFPGITHGGIAEIKLHQDADAKGFVSQYAEALFD